MAPRPYAIGAKWQNNGSADFLQLLSEGGAIQGWIDVNGVPQGSLAQGGGSGTVSTDASLTGTGAAASPLSVVGTGTIEANQYGVLANTKVSYLAAFTNNSKTVTATDGNFTQADVGKIIFGTNCTGGGSTLFLTTVVKLPQGTIQTVVNSTTVTVSVAATATLTSGNCILVWGNDDTAALVTAWAAATAVCGTLSLPAGKMLIQQAIFINVPSACTSGSGSGIEVSVIGQGASSQIIPTPNFDFTTCTGPDGSGSACFGWGSLGTPQWGGMIFKDWHIEGYGQSLSGTTHANAMIYVPSDGFLINFKAQGYGAGCTSLIGVQVGGYNATFDVMQLDHFGSTGLIVSLQNATSGAGLIIHGCVVTGGVLKAMSITAGLVQVSDTLFGTNPGSTADNITLSGGYLMATNCRIRTTGTRTVNSTGGTAHFENCYWEQGAAVGSSAILVAGGTLFVSDSFVSVQGGSGKAVSVTSGTFVNGGNNTFVDGATSTFAGGTYFAQGGGEAGQVTCSGGTANIIYKNTYLVAPIVIVSDETTAGGAKVGSITNTGAVVTAGTTDVVDFMVIPNPA